MPTRALATINLATVIATIVWSYWTNSSQLNSNTVGSVSDRYQSAITPADYAFAIWGLIYLALLLNAVYQIYCAYSGKRDQSFIRQIGPWLILANLLNSLWLGLWLYNEIGWSVLVMFGILFSLVMCIVRLRMELWDAPVRIILWVWWPLCLYSGWITVATVANVTAWLVSIGGQALLPTNVIAAIVLGVIVFINILMIRYRNMREFAGVGIWALVAIAVSNWGSNSMVSYAALLGSVLVLVAIIAHIVKQRAWQLTEKFKSEPLW